MEFRSKLKENIDNDTFELVHGTCVYKNLTLGLESVKYLVNKNDSIAITPMAATDGRYRWPHHSDVGISMASRHRDAQSSGRVALKFWQRAESPIQ
jgi:hypothetical protein